MEYKNINYIITRLTNRIMTTAEYLFYCKNLIMQLKQIDPIFNIVGIWSDIYNSDYYFKEDLSDFEDIVFAEMLESDKEFAFINNDINDKKLYLNSKSYTNFIFACGFGMNEECDISISISYGSINESRFGIVNFEFSDDYQKIMARNVIDGIVNLLISKEELLNMAVLSSELEDKIFERDDDDDFLIGWTTYLQNKDVAMYLPSTITKEHKKDGVLFSFDSTFTVSDVMKTVTLLGGKGFLNAESSDRTVNVTTMREEDCENLNEKEIQDGIDGRKNSIMIWSVFLFFCPLMAGSGVDMIIGGKERGIYILGSVILVFGILAGIYSISLLRKDIACLKSLKKIRGKQTTIMNTEEKLIEILRGMNPAPEEPLGVVIEDDTYSILSLGNFVSASILVNEDWQKFEILKRRCFSAEKIYKDALWYNERGEYETALSCIKEALHQKESLPDEQHHCRYWSAAGLFALKCDNSAEAYQFMNHALVLPDCTNNEAITMLELLAHVLEVDGEAELAKEFAQEAERRRRQSNDKIEEHCNIEDKASNTKHQQNMKVYKLATKCFEHDEATHYWTDGNKVYFKFSEVKGADIDSFESFPGNWAKDKRHCYLVSTRLLNSDPATFEILNFTYAKDKSNVWTMGGRINEADCDTFEVCDSGIKSLGKSLEWLSEKELAWYDLLVPYGYGKDKNNVYYYDYQGKYKIVKKAIPTSFHSLGDGYFGLDEKSVFCGRSVLPKANPATWKKLHADYYYSKDRERIYYFNRLIDGADAETFEVVTTPVLMGEPYQYAKDKNVGYSNDSVISHEELDKKVRQDIESYEKLKATLENKLSANN